MEVVVVGKVSTYAPQSKYNIILQTDADCTPGNNWITSMVNEF